MEPWTSPPGYPSTPHWPFSETVHSDDSTHPNPEHFVGRRVIGTEKLDGGNTGLWNGEVYARSTFLPSHDGWFAMVRKHHAYKTVGSGNLVIYGEDLYGIHSLTYEAMREDQTYRAFAVRYGDEFASWADVERYAELLDLPTVPVVFDGIFELVAQITAFFQAQRRVPSALGGEPEGFVLRVAEAFPAADFAKNVCKYVRPHHVQTDEHWKRNWQPAALTGCG